MKVYLIWLKSGNCIEGEMNSDEAERLKKEYKDNPNCDLVKEYSDKNGVILITFSLIYAMAFNDIEDDTKITGFNK